MGDDSPKPPLTGRRMGLILENIDQIEINILREIQQHLAPLFLLASIQAEKDIKILMRAALVSSPEYYALIPGGSLYGEVGNPNIEADLLTIIDLLIEHITLDSVLNPLEIKSKQISGQFVLNLIRDDFSDILGLSEASFLTEKGRLLPWLSWLLLEGGGHDLIIGWEYLEGNFKTSRTNEGIMIKEKGGGWRLSQYAGTQKDNWITRSMDKIKDIVESAVEAEFRKHLNH